MYFKRSVVSGSRSVPNKRIINTSGGPGARLNPRFFQELITLKDVCARCGLLSRLLLLPSKMWLNQELTYGLCTLINVVGLNNCLPCPTGEINPRDTRYFLTCIRSFLPEITQTRVTGNRKEANKHAGKLMIRWIQGKYCWVLFTNKFAHGLERCFVDHVVTLRLGF